MKHIDFISSYGECTMGIEHLILTCLELSKGIEVKKIDSGKNSYKHRSITLTEEDIVKIRERGVRVKKVGLGKLPSSGSLSNEFKVVNERLNKVQ